MDQNENLKNNGLTLFFFTIPERSQSVESRLEHLRSAGHVTSAQPGIRFCDLFAYFITTLCSHALLKLNLSK